MTKAIEQIPYAAHSVTEDDKEAVLRVLDSDRLTQGPEVEAFEEEFARYVGAPYAISFSSGTAALHAACQVAGVWGREVLTSALGFVASANAPKYAGADVRFTDIGEALNMTKRTAMEAMSTWRWRSTLGAILPVHFAGYPCDIKALRQLTPLPMIEDACHALGVPGVGSCEYSDFTAFSFHPSKAITTGEGGMVTCRTKANAKALKKFRNHGFEFGEGWRREQTGIGFNYRMSDIHAALGRSQLQKLPRFIEERREIAQRYYEELKGVQLPPYHSDHAWHLFVIRHKARDAIYEALRERGIETQVHYVPLYRNRVHASKYLPKCETYFSQCLSLPIHPSLSDADQSEVIRAVNDVV